MTEIETSSVHMSQKARKLISEVSEISKKIKDKNKDKGKINVFSTIKHEREEVSTHSFMIYSLLTSKYGHGKGDEFLKLFLKEIGVNENLINESWRVEREWNTKFGRIDFWLKCSKICIPIEVKIDAADQPKQLKRYEDYAKTVNENYIIVYLTLDGKNPSEQSVEGLTCKNIKLISFKENISNWLKNCLDITEFSLEVYSYIKQYLYLIEKIAGEDEMKKETEIEIDKLLKDQDNFRSAIKIAERLDNRKTDVLVEFMQKLHDKFKSKFEVKYNEEKTKTYYKNNNKLIMYIIIDKKDDLIFCCTIEIHQRLYYKFGFYNEEQNPLKFIDNADIINGNKGNNEWCEKKIELIEKLSLPEKEGGWWDYLKDRKEDKYDFKNFSENCINIIDNVEIIADKIITEIEPLKINE